MTTFIKKHSLSLALTIFALVMLRNAYLATSPFNISINRWDALAMNPFLEQTGKWAIRFLLLSLSATPIRLLTGWNPIIRLRKPAGLVAFGFALVHASLRLRPIIIPPNGQPLLRFIWQTLTSPWHITLGVLAFTVLLAMALTSHTFAMRHLKKNWKRLHRLVYPASILAISHALLNTYYGKRQGFGGPEARPELFLYLAILIVLLVIRLPFIRALLRPGSRKRASRAPDLQTSPSA
jgi:sulfoxide reductase heme-binding subunit YedZ